MAALVLVRKGHTTTETKPHGPGYHAPGYVEPEHITKQRKAISKKGFAAYKKHGTTRHPEHAKARQEMEEFNQKHGRPYNPD